MIIVVPENTECAVIGQPGDQRTIKVLQGTYLVYGSQGNDFRIRVNPDGKGFVYVLVKFLDACVRY